MYFADWRRETPLEELGAALSRIERCPPGLALIVVVPVGTFDERRRELEAKLAPLGARFAAHLHITEDDERGWTRTFAPASVPAVFLVNARRQLVWKQDDTPGGDDLAAALTRFVDPAPPLEAMPLRLVVGIGDPAPDALFDDERGDGGAIHRFRGRRPRRRRRSPGTRLRRGRGPGRPPAGDGRCRADAAHGTAAGERASS